MALLSPADLAQRLNLKKHPRSWRGDCPSCGYRSSFSLRSGKEQRALLYCSNGCPQEALGDALARIAGHVWEPPQRDVQDEAATRKRKQAAAVSMWNGSIPAAGTLADRYLTSRNLAGLAASSALRFRQDVHHPEGGRLPALMAAVTDVEGSLIAVHRTFLDATTAGKAKVTPVKASLGPVWGGAIRLDPIAAELVIGEGIESSASAGRLMGLPAWAALSAGNLERGLKLPAEVRSVVIAADRDPAGQRAAWNAAKRWRAEGRKVRVATPDEHSDFNDLASADLTVREAAHV